MSNHQDEILKYIKIQAALLSTIQKTLQRIEQNSAPASPNYRRRLSEFTGFDWSSIGAAIVESDNGGASVIEWSGQRFVRRSGSGKFGEAIWFSRAIGRDENGTEYARLITFKDFDVEPLQVQPPPGPAIKAEPPPRPIQPLDIQQTAPEALEDVTGSSPAAQASPHVAQTISGQPRQVFYQMATKAVEMQKITFDKFNGLVSLCNDHGWERGIQELQAIG